MNGKSEKCKGCDVCAQEIRRSKSAQHSETTIHLPKTGDKVRCETFKLVIDAVPHFQNKLLIEERLARSALVAHKPKIGCETCNKKI